MSNGASFSVAFSENVSLITREWIERVESTNRKNDV